MNGYVYILISCFIALGKFTTFVSNARTLWPCFVTKSVSNSLMAAFNSACVKKPTSQLSVMQTWHCVVVLHAGDIILFSPWILWLISFTVAVLLVACCDG